MKTKIFLFFVSLFLVASVSATGFSPSSLEFNLKQGEQQCQTVTLTSDSETITISDQWAENKDIEWKVSLFNQSSSYHKITMSYPNQLSLDQRTAEVCLSGEQVGEYHGVLLLREEQEGNSIIQMGIWIKAVISEPTQTAPVSSGSGGGSGGGGGGGSSRTTPTVTKEETKITEPEEKEDVVEKETEVEEETETNENELTGMAAVSEDGIVKTTWFKILIGSLIILGIIIGLYFWRRGDKL